MEIADLIARMAPSDRIDGFFVMSDSVGKWWRGGRAGMIAANVWVFPEGVVVTPASLRSRHSPIRSVRRADPVTLTPDAIEAAYPKVVRLDGDRVRRIVLGDRRSEHAFNPYWVTFELVGQRRFGLAIPHNRIDDGVAMLAEVYGSRFDDIRTDR